MPIQVQVLSQADYAAEVTVKCARPRWRTILPRFGSRLTLIARGEKVYAGNCAACHQASQRQGRRTDQNCLSAAVVPDPGHGQADPRFTERCKQARCRWKQLTDTEPLRCDYLATKEQLVEQDGPVGGSRPWMRRRQVTVIFVTENRNCHERSHRSPWPRATKY
jgi:cytochrome c oxidase subunit 2